MPPPETFERNQTATYWPKTGSYASNEPIFGNPSEVSARWEHGHGRVFDPTGEPVFYQDSVILDFMPPLGSLFWEGSMSSWYGVGSAGDDTGLLEVIAVIKQPDLKARYHRCVVRLRKFRRVPL